MRTRNLSAGICWYVCKLQARGEGTMVTWPLLPACVCNALSVTQFSSFASFWWGKKVLNYTHPWRDVINFAAYFFVISP